MADEARGTGRPVEDVDIADARQNGQEPIQRFVLRETKRSLPVGRDRRVCASGEKASRGLIRIVERAAMELERENDIGFLRQIRQAESFDYDRLEVGIIGISSPSISRPHPNSWSSQNVRRLDHGGKFRFVTSAKPIIRSIGRSDESGIVHDSSNLANICKIARRNMDVSSPFDGLQTGIAGELNDFLWRQFPECD